MFIIKHKSMFYKVILVMPFFYRKRMVYQLSQWVKLIRPECGKLVNVSDQHGLQET